MRFGNYIQEIKMKKFSFFIVFLAMLFVAGTAHGASYYMSRSGSDSNACSQSAPCATLAKAFKMMSGGDTLYVADGTYSDQITQSLLPPGGSAGKYTTIRAMNIPCQDGVACGQPLKVTFTNGININNYLSSPLPYVKIQGIYFKNGVSILGGASSSNPASMITHWYFKQCAVQGGSDGNNAAWTMSSMAYLLLEDCIAFGKGRYKFLFYDGTRTGTSYYNVCRRCISRNDWVNDSGNPMADFVAYYARDVAWLNCIAIDGGNSASYWSSNEWVGAFSQVVDSGFNINVSVLGSMVVNVANNAIYFRTAGSGMTVRDFVSVNTIGGVHANASTNMTRLSILNAGQKYFSGSTTYPIDAPVNVGVNSGGGSLNNSLVRNSEAAATNASYSGDYFNYYPSSVGSTFHPTHTYTSDPYANGLLYPVRVETGSALANAVSGGMGANITQTLGADGAEYGSTGWNAATGASIWPWPYEGWVKAQMAAMDTTISGNVMPSPTRGFAGGTSKDGSPQTLTKYIWEFLGNKIPSDISSGDSGGTASLTPPTGLRLIQ
jgi:hypothetical protein